MVPDSPGNGPTFPPAQGAERQPRARGQHFQASVVLLFRSYCSENESIDQEKCPVEDWLFIVLRDDKTACGLLIEVHSSLEKAKLFLFVSGEWRICENPSGRRREPIPWLDFYCSKQDHWYTNAYSQWFKVVTLLVTVYRPLRLRSEQISPASMPPKVGPLSQEVLGPAPISAGMTIQNTRTLLRSDEWCALDSRNAQVTFFYEFCQINSSTRFNSRDIRIIFNIREDYVPSICHKALIKKRPPYHSLALELQQEEVVQFVWNGFVSQNYVTQRDPLNYVE
jgi:hypothetical protein